MCYCYLYNPYCLERVIRLCLLAMFMVELAVLAVGTLWVMDNDIECVDTIIDNSRDCVLMLWTMVIIRLLGSLRVKEWMSAHTTIDGYANPHAQEYEYQHDHSKQKENDHQLRSGDMDVNIDVNEAKGR